MQNSGKLTLALLLAIKIEGRPQPSDGNDTVNGTEATLNSGAAAPAGRAPIRWRSTAPAPSGSISWRPSPGLSRLRSTTPQAHGRIYGSATNQ